MGEVISLEAERIKRDAKKLMVAENWLAAHQDETIKFLDYRRDEAFTETDRRLASVWADTEDGTRDGV